MNEERRRQLGWVAAALVPFGASAALIPLRPHLLNANLALILVLVVLGAAVVGGLGAGIVAALSAAVGYDLFLTVPYGSLTIEDPDDIETTILLAAIGLVAGWLVDRTRRSEAAAVARRAELARAQRRAELAAGGERPGRLIARSAEELTDILDLKACRYVPGPAPETMAVFTHGAIRVPGVAGDGPPGAVALPVRAHGRDIGHFILVFPVPSYGVAVPLDARHEAVALADQLGLALLRYRDG